MSLTQIKCLITSFKETEQQKITPQQQVKEFSKKLRKGSRTVEPKTWRKIQNYMDKIEKLLIL